MSDYAKITDFAAKDALAPGNPSKIITGTAHDNEYNAISVAVATKADTAGPTFTGTVTIPALTVTGVATFSSSAAISHNSLSTRPVPVGGIILWSGATAAIPSGWVICNGSNGTPDLRDKFVVGAGNSYAVGATGGTANVTSNYPHTHTWSGTSSGVSANHTHSFSASTSSDGAHTHQLYAGNIVVLPLYGAGTGLGFPAGAGFSAAASATDTGSSGTHSHTLSGTTGSISADHTHSVSGTTSSDGSAGVNANLPPYYALAYIMCVA